MSDNSRNQRNSAITGAATMAAAIAAGLAFEHAHAQSNNRESVVQGIRRWVTDAVTAVADGPSAMETQQRRPRPRGNAPSSSAPSSYSPYDFYDGGGGGAAAASRRRGQAAAADHAQRPLTRAEVDALPVRVVTDVDSIDGLPVGDDAAPGAANNREKSFCVVCREPYVTGDRLLRLPCFHEFHCDCIREYLETSDGALCPICRHPVLFS